MKKKKKKRSLKLQRPPPCMTLTRHIMPITTVAMEGILDMGMAATQGIAMDMDREADAVSPTCKAETHNSVTL